MAVPTSFRTTTSGSLKLNTQNSGDLLLHPPSRALRSQTTISFPTMKVLGSNPMAAHHLPTCTPTKVISQTFTKLKSEGKVALIPYITAGDPDLSTTAQALKLLDSCGANIIELGIPFSDPLLDGPVIRASASRSLVGGTNLSKIISMLEEVVPQLSCPITIFSYANPILKHGVENFMSKISQAGVRGLVVPDASFECTQLRNEAAKKNVEMVLLTTPATRTDRMKDIVQASEGFVYLVSSVGVTGARERVNKQVPRLLREIKEVTSKPVAVGFGLSKPEHFKQVAEWGADGAIVGSAIVKVLGEARSSLQGLRELETLAKSFKSALP